MRSFARPITLLPFGLFLSLLISNHGLAFECSNSGDSTTAPDDGGSATRTACGDGAVALADFGTAIGRLATASGGFSTALGESAQAAGHYSTALGRSATVDGYEGTAVGTSATASGDYGTALGYGATANGIESTALGFGTYASGVYSTALGSGAAATGDSNIALGTYSRALSPHTNATAVGFLAQVEQSNAMVLGSIPGVNDPLENNEYVDVGIGTTMPEAPLHVERANGTARVLVMETEPGPSMPFQGVAQGLVRFELNDEAAGERWRFTNAGSKFAINNVGGDSPGTEMSVFKNGDMVIGGLLTENSDVNAKQDIVPVDNHDVLARIAKLKIAEWSYKDAPNQRHVGPMAQDFHATFGLGRDNKHIATLDTSGVALAGIQALKEQHEKAIAEKNAELVEVKNRLARLESLIQGLNKPVAGL